MCISISSHSSTFCLFGLACRLRAALRIGNIIIVVLFCDRAIHASRRGVMPITLDVIGPFGASPSFDANLCLLNQVRVFDLDTLLVGEVIGMTLFHVNVFELFDGIILADVFELLNQDQDPVTNGFQPFAPGGFFSDGEIFRNELLSPDDPAATPAGEQLDYSVVRASDVGSGPAASFRLRALAPAAGSTIRIDESGIRETRYFKPDGTHESFRFITPLSVDVRGITIQGLPEQIVLSRGQVDSTSFVLDRMLFDPVYSPQDIDWHVDATEALDVRLDLETRRLILTAPTDRSLWEQLTLRAVNPDGQTTSATFDLFVDAGPVLTPHSGVIEIAEDEDHRISLDGLAEDLDSPD